MWVLHSDETHLSPTAIGTFLTCQHAATLKASGYVLRDEGGDGMRKGGLFATLAARFHVERGCPPNDWTRENTADEAILAQARGRMDLLEEAKAMLESYAAWFDEHPLDVVCVEEELTATIGELDPGGPDSTLDDIVIFGRIDLLGVDRSVGQHETVLVDHKTGRPKTRGDGLDPWHELGMTVEHWGQMMTYLHLLRTPRNAARFGPIARAYIQRVRNIPPYTCDRQQFDTPDRRYARHPRMLRAVARLRRQMMRDIEEGWPPITNLWACTKRYGLCDFASLCAATEATLDTVLAMEYK